MQAEVSPEISARISMKNILVAGGRQTVRIVHKGIVMVSIPLVFQLVFAFGMLALEQRLEQLTAAESKSKELLYHLNEIFTLSFDLVVDKMVERFSGFIPRGTAQAVDELIDSEIKKAEELIPPHSEQYTRFQALKTELAFVSGAIEGFNLRRDESASFSMLMGNVPHLMKLSKRTGRLRDSMNAVRAPEAARTLAIAMEMKQLRQELQILTFVTIGMSVVIATVLMIFFVRNVTERIALLVSNSRLLGDRQPLLSPLTGNDELAELDRSFRAADQSLRNLEEMKRDFYHMVAHDLRSPLSGVSMTIGMFKSGMFGEPSEKAMAKYALVERSVANMLSLVNDILEIEKLSAGKMPLELVVTNSTSMVQQTVHSIESLAGAKNITIVQQCEPFEIQCDHRRILQALINLGANAIKFSTKNSTIEFHCETKDSCGHFSVKDHGRGIPAENLKRLFQKFEQVQTADSAYGFGTGLGLTISKMIVDAHGGKISVESETGVGTTFTLVLPLAQSDFTRNTTREQDG